MPEPLVPASIAVVVLGLGASLGWGISDFAGGFGSRYAPVLGVLLCSQLGSLALSWPALVLFAEPVLRPDDVAYSTLGGIFGATGLGFLYRGLSVGRMGVVAPVAGVLTALLPVVFGFATQGVPPPAGIIGIVVAALSVVLVSRSGDAGDGRPSGIGYALAAGSCFGLFAVSASQLDDDLLVWPIFLVRVASVLTVAAWILVIRRPWRVPRRLWAPLVAIGLVDMVATGLYLAAIGVGPLSIAASLASLYPVVTVIIAAVFLRERVTRVHAVGIVAAGVAVALIAGATA